MKIGKKIIAGAMLSCGAAFSFSEVQAQTCVVPPSCEKLGYSMSVTDCDGQRYIRCPLDVDNDNAVYCSKACSCPRGSSHNNSCTSYSSTVQGECGNTCYECWDGITLNVPVTLVCYYNEDGSIKSVAYDVSGQYSCQAPNGATIGHIGFPSFMMPNDQGEEYCEDLKKSSGSSATSLEKNYVARALCRYNGDKKVTWTAK